MDNEDQIRMGIEYMRSRSLWPDLQLLPLAIPAVLSGAGA
jgi:lipopolysaccharide/colanic/teichoic acid biosynthesis glycosyltransferase